MGVEQRFLHNIAGIEAALQYTVHPQIDHPPQRRAVSLHQRAGSRLLAGRGLSQQFLGFTRIGPHR